MSRYPVIYAGQRITAELQSSMLVLEAYKATGTTRSSTTTFADDPDLTIALEANATYWVEMYIKYAAVTAEQFKTNWTVPSGATGGRARHGLSSSVNDTTAGGPFGDGAWGHHGFTTTLTYGTRNSASNQVFAYEIGFVTTSTTAGNVALSWAQNASGATGTSVSAGSYMRAKRIF
ncbi:hypothetical protein ACGFNY_05145 [Streptomyces chartreusis]|uniref:hypothetical protein n=1 Tax=Streptomyces chartreusis TaxID=1969 RepID=UPI0037218AAE